MENDQKSRLFCDSELVLEKLINSNLVDNKSLVLTRSFKIANNPAVNSVYIDENLNSKTRLEFKRSIKLAETELRNKLCECPYSEAEKIIILQLYNKFQNELLDAMLLSEDYAFDGKTFIAIPITGEEEIDEILRPSWLNWLPKKNLTSLEVKVPYHDERAPRGNVKATYFDRIKLGGWQAIVWKLAQMSLLPDFVFKGKNIGIVGQTELLRDVVAESVLNLARPIFIERPSILNSDWQPDFELALSVIAEVQGCIVKRFSWISSPNLRDKALDIFANKLANELGQFKFLKSEWQKYFDNNPKLDLIFSGYSMGPQALAMAATCNENGIKTVAFQHGITREMLSNADERSILFETSFCDVFVTMNQVSTAITNTLSTNKKQIISKGWPSALARISKQNSKPSSEILFVSTNLYSGHRPNGVPPTSDKHLCILEQGIVEGVLGKINKRVDYKPYPAIRHLDKDPVIASVRSQKNMKVVGSHQELRYILPKFKIFVTSRATSTLSWIVATEKPFVFIDHFCHARLSQQAKEDFCKAFFLFDQKDKNFHEELIDFLQQPFCDINSQWKAKSTERQLVVERYFSGTVHARKTKILHAVKLDN